MRHAVPTPIESRGDVECAQVEGRVAFGVILTSAPEDADRRFGRQALALDPLIRLGRPAPAVRRVSCGPSAGKRAWPSRQILGLLKATSLRGFASNSQEILP